MCARNLVTLLQPRLLYSVKDLCKGVVCMLAMTGVSMPALMEGAEGKLWTALGP